MAILLTGGAGYIGSHTAAACAAAGYDVVIADDFSNSSPDVPRRLEEITGRKMAVCRVDAADREAMRRALGLDRPLAEQYLDYLGGLARLELGTSFQDPGFPPRPRPVFGLHPAPRLIRGLPHFDLDPPGGEAPGRQQPREAAPGHEDPHQGSARCAPGPSRSGAPSAPRRLSCSSQAS